MRYAFVKCCLAVALVAGLATPVKTCAQKTPGTISFKWGEEYELPKRFEDLGFVGNATDGYLQIGHRNHEALSFQKFDRKLKLSGEQETDISSLPRDYSNEFFTQLGDKYYWFFSTYDKHEDEEKLYAQEIDVKEGTTTGKARRLLATTKLMGNMELTGMFRAKLTDKWNFYFSFDKKNLLIEYRKKAEKDDDNRNSVIGFNVYDASLNKLWSREVRLPFEEQKRAGDGEYQIDSRGNVYRVVKVLDEDGERRRPNFHFEVLKWSKDDLAIKHIPFRFTDKFVNNATLSEDPKGGIVVAGYYSNKRNTSSTDGVFILKLDEKDYEFRNVMKGTYAFPLELLTQFENARTRRYVERRAEKGKDVEAPNMVMRKLIINSDGSIQVFGEESFVIVTTTRTNNSTYTTYTYYYNDILAMDIGSDGNMRWVRKIPKSQVTGAESGPGKYGTMSYRQYSHNGDTYFFFMDNEKNLDLATDEAPVTQGEGRGILAAVKVDKDGKVSKQMVYDSHEEKVRLAPANFDEVGDNQLIVRGQAKGRTSKAALITFN